MMCAVCGVCLFVVYVCVLVGVEFVSGCVFKCCGACVCVCGGAV